ncbi:MAG: GGDEF domain-containing protein [Planctomycetes bacterium]|nr:GGDEF domain-containing protein [Planctomycetota bacterium]
MSSLFVQFFRSISESLGQTIAGGYIVAITVICLLQYVVHVYKFYRASQRSSHQRRMMETLEAELSETRREHAVARLENDLLQEITTHSESGGTFDLLARRFAPNRAEDFCVIVKPEPTGDVVLHSRGLSAESLSRLKIDKDLRRQVQRKQPVILERVRLYESQLMAGLAPEDRKKAKQIYLLAFGDSDDLRGVMATTSLYPSGIPRERQIALARRLMQCVSSNLKHTHALEMQEGLLRTTSEMLELRKIADQHFSNPLLMIELFLKQFSERIHFDRTAVYMTTLATEVSDTSLVRTGPSLQVNLLRQWHLFEDILAEFASNQTESLTFDKSQLKDFGIETLIGRALVAPLIFDDRMTGLLCLTDSRTTRLDESETRLVKWAAEYLAETIHRVLNHAVVERQARQDFLTLLANRRTFDSTILEVISNCRKNGTCCSLLLLDLDHFKAINDTYGHQAGDVVLRLIAEILQNHLQSSDLQQSGLAARYGGEEMAMLLPEIDVNEAAIIGETLRAAVESAVFPAGEHDLKITISIGVAAFPDHAETVEELIAQADNALYEAKHLGRNRLVYPSEIPA